MSKNEYLLIRYYNIFFYLAVNTCEGDMIYLGVLDGDMVGGGVFDSRGMGATGFYPNETKISLH